MANQAAKKRAKAKASMKNNLSTALVAVNAIYVVATLVFSASDILTFYSFWLPFSFFGILNGVIASGILQSVASGLTYELYFDLFCITLLVQLGTAFSHYFWYVYIVVPAYFLYQGIVCFSIGSSLPIPKTMVTIHLTLSACLGRSDARWNSSVPRKSGAKSTTKWTRVFTTLIY